MPAPDFISTTHIVSDKADVFSIPGTLPGDTVRLLASASYMNFIVANGVVLMPKYWRTGNPLSQKDKDNQSLHIMQENFPDKKIIQIDVTELNFGGGGMHRLTQQQPSLTNNP
jgi:agmatine deiminase